MSSFSHYFDWRNNLVKQGSRASRNHLEKVKVINLIFWYLDVHNLISRYPTG
jgi:hypothetical protein